MFLLSYIVNNFVTAVPPQVTISSPANRTEDTGDNIMLDCGFIGVPKPEVTWTLNGTVIDTTTNTDFTLTSEQLSGSFRSQLMVSNVSPMTAKGVYQCLLVNSLGMDSGTYNVRIRSEWWSGVPLACNYFSLRVFSILLYSGEYKCFYPIMWECPLVILPD